MNETEYEENIQRDKKKRWLFVAIGIVIVVLAMVAAWLFLYNPATEPANEAENAEAQETEGFSDVEVVLESKMEDGTANEIKAITDAFIMALTKRNAADIMKYKSAEFQVTQGQLTTFFESATAKDKKPYELFATYYLNNVENPDTMVRVKKSETDDDYVMLTPGKAEMCAALFLSKNDKVSQMITLLMARGEEKMEIVWIDTSDYDYYGQKAPDYLNLAKKAKEEGKNVLTYVYAQMMHNIFQPGNAYYYKETDEITAFVNERNQWGQENLPITVVDDKHTVHIIGLALEDVGVVPMIYCQTEVDIGSEGIQADAEKVKDAFLEKFPELKGAFEKIVVHASNITPAEDTTGANYIKIVFDMK